LRVEVPRAFAPRARDLLVVAAQRRDHLPGAAARRALGLAVGGAGLVVGGHARASVATGERRCRLRSWMPMNEHVLVVDDDPPVRRMLERTLAAEGHAVTTAADGGAALAAVEREAPDLVILDVAMPGIDGLAVTQRLRGKGMTAPILLLTARDAVADRVEGLDAGADDYLTKPFAVEELIARVRALTRRVGGSTSQLAVGELTLDLDTRTVLRAGRGIELTAR